MGCRSCPKVSPGLVREMGQMNYHGCKSCSPYHLPALVCRGPSLCPLAAIISSFCLHVNYISPSHMLTGKIISLQGHSGNCVKPGGRGVPGADSLRSVGAHPSPSVEQEGESQEGKCHSSVAAATHGSANHTHVSVPGPPLPRLLPCT